MVDQRIRAMEQGFAKLEEDMRTVSQQLTRGEGLVDTRVGRDNDVRC